MAPVAHFSIASPYLADRIMYPAPTRMPREMMTCITRRTIGRALATAAGSGSGLPRANRLGLGVRIKDVTAWITLSAALVRLAKSKMAAITTSTMGVTGDPPGGEQWGGVR